MFQVYMKDEILGKSWRVFYSMLLPGNTSLWLRNERKSKFKFHTNFLGRICELLNLFNVHNITFSHGNRKSKHKAGGISMLVLKTCMIIEELNNTV